MVCNDSREFLAELLGQNPFLGQFLFLLLGHYVLPHSGISYRGITRRRNSQCRVLGQRLMYDEN
jgi:hypothetical protein